MARRSKTLALPGFQSEAKRRGKVESSTATKSSIKHDDQDPSHSSSSNNDINHARSWAFVRQNLNKALVSRRMNHGYVGVQSLPTLASTMKFVRPEAHHTQPSTKPNMGAHPEQIPPARRLYEGPGAVVKRHASKLRGKRIIGGPFGDTDEIETNSVGSHDSIKSTRLRRHDDDQQPSAKDSENNSEDTPEFMNRLFAGVKSRRRVSQRERDFEQALERQKWKQARSDEFFGIYRRTHEIESTAAGFSDYLLLEAVYDIDFNKELSAMCLTTSSRQKVQSQSRFPDHRRESTAKISGETTAIAEDPKDAAAAANYHDPAELRCSSIDSITFVSANEDGVGSGHSIIEGGREPSREETSGIVSGVSGFGHGGSRGEGGDAWSEGSELTLGRPKSSSIHWKYCRRLLQTHTVPVALTKTVIQGVEVDFSLPHQSLGDTYIKFISEVLEDLPKITRLNLRDNRLTDVAVQKIVGAICSNMRGSEDIEILDLSENKLDAVSARSLSTFFRSPRCRLREVFLAKADIDDEEMAIIMEAMKQNSSVEYLDFSNNSIGGGNEKTQRSTEGTTTGGMSIAQALRVNATLKKIDLQWNMLGSKSGILLGDALSNNHTLEWLNVSYNSLGEKGAQAIGMALAVNDTLVRLDLSYNEISPRGVLVIAQALERNDRLQVLRLDGNSFGVDGGRTLVRSLNYWTIHRTIGLNHCMLESKSGLGACFDPLYLTGRYSLDCSDPYEKAVAYELLRSASVLPGSSVKQVVA